MFIASVPFLVRSLPSLVVWNFPTREKKIFLTFDDGPTPEITPVILDYLKKYNAKGTFFCLGKNIKNNIQLFNRISEEGHSIGNHTHNHLNGWKTKNNEYFEDISLAHKENPSKLFRPPYGRIKAVQAIKLRRNYKIIMWDVLSGDYNQKISPEQCLKNVLWHTRPGSIVVFHDSYKAQKNLLYTLPKMLEYFSSKGFSFAPIV